MYHAGFTHCLMPLGTLFSYTVGDQIDTFKKCERKATYVHSITRMYKISLFFIFQCDHTAADNEYNNDDDDDESNNFKEIKILMVIH